MSTTVEVDRPIYDCIGIGFGPSNIALAIALQERGLLAGCLFLEARPQVDWHPGMLIEGTDIQHNPLRDLVTPRNPQSPYGFLAYLSAQGRLFDYLNLAAPYPPRTEYAGYIRWVGSQFEEYVRPNSRATRLTHSRSSSGEDLLEVSTADGCWFLSRTISLGPGRCANIPSGFLGLMGPNVVHLNDYLWAKERWTTGTARRRVAVVGGSQSAIEIILDLHNVADVVSVSRGFGFKQKDLSPFTERIYYPDFVDYFHGSSVDSQNHISKELRRSNYGAADPDVISKLNLVLYEQMVTGRRTIEVRHSCEMTQIERDAEAYVIELTDRHSGQQHRHVVDGIVLATGFLNFGNGDGQEPYHPLLHELSSTAEFRTDGGIAIDRDYRMANRPQTSGRAPVFINGLCESSHGFGDAGSFSLLSIRSGTIAASIEKCLAATNASQTEPFIQGARARA